MSSTHKKRALFRRGHYGNPIGLMLFLLPGVGAYTLIVLYPIVLSFVYSMIEWQGLRPLWQFNNFEFYVRMLHDRRILSALANNGRAWVLYALIQVPLALLLGFVLSRRIRGVAFFRFLYFIPEITSVLLLALIFRFFLTMDFGLNGMLKGLGLGALIRPWLSGDGIVQWVVNIPQTWAGVGFWVVIFIAAIHGVSEELFEAAQLDGASGWQQLIYVTIPSMRGVLLFAYVLAAVWSLQAFLYQLLMPGTPGGPMNLSHTLGSYIVSYTLASEARIPLNWGYASALAVSLFILCVIASLLVWRVSRWSRAMAGE